MMPSHNKRTLIITVASFLLLWAGFLIYSRINQTVLEVNAPPESTIYLSIEKGGEFAQIGIGSARYIAEGPGIVFVKVENGDDQSIVHAELIKSETTRLQVDTRPITNAEKIASRALSYMHFDDSFVFGVNPISKSFAYADLSGENRTYNPPFFSLPFLSKIVWYDHNNFLYFTGKVSAIIAGEQKELGYRRTNGSRGFFIDVARASDRPAVVLSQEGIHLEDSLRAFKFSKIIDLDSVTSPRLFADNKYLYLVDYEFEQFEDEGTNPIIIGTTFRVFDYSGEEVHKYNLTINEYVTNLVYDSDSDNFLLLGESKISLVNRQSSEESDVPYYFDNTVDINDSTEKGILLLTTAGLWTYDIDDNFFYLISSFPDGEEYVANSLFSTDTGTFYSTQISRQALISRSGVAASSIYRVGF